VDLGSGPPVCAALPAAPSLPPPSGVASGTRLVQRMLAETVPGGVVVPWSVHDVLLDVDCSPARMEDGTLRCYGADLRAIPEQFADAALTIPVVVVARSEAPAAGGLVVTGGSSTADPFDGLVSCHRAASAGRWRRGDARAATMYYRRSGGPVIVPASFAVFDLVPEPTEFVELREVRTRLSGSIALRELHGVDGSRVFATHLYDTAHDVPVSLSTSPTDFATRLLPPLVSEEAAFFHRPTDCFARDPIFKPLADFDCDASALRFATDAANNDAVFQVAYTAGSTLYRCAGSASDFGPVAIKDPLLGACRPSPLSDWASAALTPTPGARLTARIWKVGDAVLPLPLTTLAPLAAPRVFSDPTLGIDCMARTASDSALRCLPRALAGIAFSDAACTSRVAVPFDSSPPRYASSISNPLTPRDVPTDVFPVGAQRPSAPVYRLTATGCQAGGTQTTYELGPELDPTTFAALELRDAPPAPAP
jgi:hypothetical protein